MKYLYIVDYWVPFPSSEYGGIINVIAENDKECHDILRDDEDHGFDDRYESKIMEQVVSAIKLKLADPEESRIVECFAT